MLPSAILPAGKVEVRPAIRPGVFLERHVTQGSLLFLFSYSAMHVQPGLIGSS